jgi:hypothetical protein
MEPKSIHMIITDCKGDTFPVCPRCGGEWKISGNTPWDDPNIDCLTKNCMYVIGEHLMLALDNWQIMWQKDKCIAMNGYYAGVVDFTDMPILPYDITIDRLKLLLMFS